MTATWRAGIWTIDRRIWSPEEAFSALVTETSFCVVFAVQTYTSADTSTLVENILVEVTLVRVAVA